MDRAQMVHEYIEAANKLMEMAEDCEDCEVADLLKAKSLKIFELAASHGGIIKTASEKTE